MSGTMSSCKLAQSPHASSISYLCRYASLKLHTIVSHSIATLPCSHYQLRLRTLKSKSQSRQWIRPASSSTACIEKHQFGHHPNSPLKAPPLPHVVRWIEAMMIEVLVKEAFELGVVRPPDAPVLRLHQHYWWQGRETAQVRSRLASKKLKHRGG